MSLSHRTPSQHTISSHHWPTSLTPIELAFSWWTDGGPHLVVYWDDCQTGMDIKNYVTKQGLNTNGIPVFSELSM